jgi:hypothetical protein
MFGYDCDTLFHDQKERVNIVSVRLLISCPSSLNPVDLSNPILVCLTYRRPSGEPSTYLWPYSSTLSRFDVALFPSLCHQLEHRSK